MLPVLLLLWLMVMLVVEDSQPASHQNRPDDGGALGAAIQSVLDLCRE